MADNSSEGFVLACGMMTGLLHRIISRGVILTKEEKTVHKEALKIINRQYKRNVKADKI